MNKIKKLFIIEDSEFDREIYQIVLNRILKRRENIFEYQFSESLKKFQDAKIDLSEFILISDFKIGPHTAIDFLKEIKKSESLPKAIYVITNSLYEKNITDAYQWGIDDYIIKPDSPKELEYILNKIISTD